MELFLKRLHDRIIHQSHTRSRSGIDHSGTAVKPFGFWRDRLFIVGCAAYGVTRWVLKPHLHSSFLHSYFNDLWLIQCALPLVLFLHCRLRLRSTSPPTFLEVAGHLAIWSALFEWWGPKFWPRTTGDPWDVVCYCAGGLAAWLWWNAGWLQSSRVRSNEL